MGTFSDSWALTKTSFRVIREEKALLLFPLVSGLCALGVIILFVAGFFTLLFYTSISTGTLELVAGVLALLVYFALWILSVFFAAALVGAATIKLNGGHPTFHDGIQAARAKLGKLILWALLGGTIMLIIRAIASRLKGIAGLIFGIAAGVTLGAITYFMIPVLLYENEGTWASLKRSASLFGKNFGRTLVSNLVLGLIVLGGFILGIVLIVAGVSVAFTTLLPGIVLAVVGIAFLVFMVILASAATGVLTAALYRFATTGQVVPGLIPPKYLLAQSQGIGGAGGQPLTSAWPPPPPPPTLPPVQQA
jgi:hypothetical protein